MASRSAPPRLAPACSCWHYLTRGLATRAVGAVIAVAGFGSALGGAGSGNGGGSGFVLAGLGAFVFTAGTIDDLVNAPYEARLRNSRIKSVTIAPTVTPHAASFVIAGAF